MPFFIEIQHGKKNTLFKILHWQFDWFLPLKLPQEARTWCCTVSTLGVNKTRFLEKAQGKKIQPRYTQWPMEPQAHVRSQSKNRFKALLLFGLLNPQPSSMVEAYSLYEHQIQPKWIQIFSFSFSHFSIYYCLACTRSGSYTPLFYFLSFTSKCNECGC